MSEINNSTPWPEYPRPQFKRDSFFNLNGQWKLTVNQFDKIIYDGNITVPFPPESDLSGVKLTPSKDNILTYEKKFILPENFNKGKVLLHFGACDQETRVSINGDYIGENVGGYLPFSFDITDYINDYENLITVDVVDTLDQALPYGKQRFKRGGMWYTPISGIWQTVWLESVPENHVESIQVTTTVDTAVISVKGGIDEKKLILLNADNEETKEFDFSGSSIKITLNNPENWTPENPKLYYFKLISGQDTVESYFALRTISIDHGEKHPRLLLNGKPYFFHGLLDQGYFQDGIFLPASPQGFLNDIKAMKALGFNTLRKHIKIEPELFYYYCDREGMAVFQDFVNNGKYSFLIDTALPTIGLKKGITHKATPWRAAMFESTANDTVELLYNHPSVVYYTIFNEGWGQYEPQRIYEKMKSLDPSRIWDTTSGWFNNSESDVISEHVYFKKLKIKADKKNRKPLILSEFGGYACKIKGHLFNEKKDYGYKFFDTPEKLQEALSNLYLKEVLPLIEKEGLSATILTQVSDVEDEINGLLTYDREVCKVDKKAMNDIAEKLIKACK